MRKHLTIGSAFLAFAFGAAAPASAKQHDTTERLRVDSITAIHLPTGCEAMMEFHDGIFAAGFITDPLCLPKGVKRQPIPSVATDYTRTQAAKARLTSR